MARTAAAMIIGNELLSGKVRDANTQVLARELRALGVELRRVVVVPDEVPEIARELCSLRGTHDLVFTSGGVGPTHDDVTVEGIALGLGRRVERHEGIVRFLQEHLGPRCTEGHLAMARVVEGTELVGLDARWPAMVLGNVVVLPGVPESFASGLKALREHLRGDEAPYVLLEVLVAVDEGTIKPALDAVVLAFPDVSVGSYPRYDTSAHKVRVTFDGRDPARVRAAYEAFARSLDPEHLVR
jgi:molybdenum cofactor synthesis domain-containing protein